MARRHSKREWSADERNARIFWHYMELLKEIACNVFQWQGLPSEIDVRFLEITLYESSLAIFFKDDARIRARATSSSPMLLNGDTDKFFALQGAPAGTINMYRNPTEFMAYGPGGFSRMLKADECVPIWGNFLRQPTTSSIEYYARRLAEFDITIDVNLRAHKTPVVFAADESMKLTMRNFFKQYEEGEPVIYIPSSTLAALTSGEMAITSITTDAKYVIDKLLIDKAKVWAEAMTFLGIDNANQEKRERLVANEVKANDGQIESSRLRGLDARRQACEQINEMYGLNVSVHFNHDWISSNARLANDHEMQHILGVNESGEVHD